MHVLRANGARLGALAGSATDWADLAAETGARWGVDPALILSVIAAESSGDPGAVNPSDPSYGLMQVTPATASWLLGRPVAADELLDPLVNVELGTRYLKYQLDRYGGDVAAAVNAYRAGTASDTPRSQSYVARVLGWLEAFGASLVGTAEATEAPAGEAGVAPMVAIAPRVEVPWWGLAAATGVVLWLLWARR